MNMIDQCDDYGDKAIRISHTFRSIFLQSLLSLIALTCTILFLQSGSGVTITVDDDGGEDFDTIRDAIGNASTGDTVFVREGFYHENLMLNKSIVLSGTENSTIVGNGRSTIVITSDGVVIDSLTVSNINGGAGILIQANDVEVIHCKIIQSGDGIRIEESNHVRVVNNEISDNENGIVVENPCWDLSITENTISFNMNGIIFDHILSDNSPTPRSCSATAYDSNRDQVLIYGGYSRDPTDNQGKCENETWIFDVGSSTWSQIKCEITPPPLKGCGLVFSETKDRFLLFGGGYGDDDKGHDGQSNETWYFYPENQTWVRQHPEESPSPRSTMGTAISEENSTVYVYGGYAGDPHDYDIYLDDTWCYYLENDTWEELSPSSTPDRKLGGGMVFDNEMNKLIWFGGKQRSNGMNINQVWEYNITSNGWYEVTDQNPPSPPPVSQRVF